MPYCTVCGSRDLITNKPYQVISICSSCINYPDPQKYNTDPNFLSKPELGVYCNIRINVKNKQAEITINYNKVVIIFENIFEF